MEPVPGKGPGIFMYGEYVTEKVKEKIGYLMRENRFGNEIYETRSACTAFFQGGHNDPTDKFVFIEFWSPERVGPFLEIFNREVCPLIVPCFTELRVNMYTWEEKGALTMCLMIAEETNCDYEAPNAFVFKPETSTQHNKIYKLLRLFNLPIING
jgi:hypothetical protein